MTWFDARRTEALPDDIASTLATAMEACCSGAAEGGAGSKKAAKKADKERLKAQKVSLHLSKYKSFPSFGLHVHVLGVYRKRELYLYIYTRFELELPCSTCSLSHYIDIELVDL